MDDVEGETMITLAKGRELFEELSSGQISTFESCIESP